MNPARLLLTTLAAALAAPASALAQSPATLAARRVLAFEVPADLKAQEVRWVGSWDRALEEAKRRNEPVVAMLSDDKSAGFRTVRAAVFSRPAFADFSRRCVLLAAFDGTAHGSKPRKIDERDVAWCDLFDCDCADHRSSFQVVRDRFAQREFWHPLQILVSPADEELARVEGHKATQEALDEELAGARKALGPGLDYDDYRGVMARLRALVDAREKKGHAAAVQELRKLLEAEARAAGAGGPRVLKTDGMQQFVEDLLVALLQEGEGLIADAEAASAGGDAEGARRLLVRVQRSFKGLAPAAAADAAIAKLPPPPAPKKKQ